MTNSPDTPSVRPGSDTYEPVSQRACATDRPQHLVLAGSRLTTSGPSPVPKGVCETASYVSTAGDSVTSRLIASLDRVWAEIRVRHSDVPPVVVAIGAGSIGTPPGVLKLGHFAAGRWQHDTQRLAELFVGGEGLQHGPIHVLGTLLHEAAHGVADTRGIKD